jgi:hypothetical protein
VFHFYITFFVVVLLVCNLHGGVFRTSGGDKASKLYETPDCIRNLRPKDAPALCKITWDQRRVAFEAYYPGGKPTRSTSATYGPHLRSKLEALTSAVDYIWRNHGECGYA